MYRKSRVVRTKQRREWVTRMRKERVAKLQKM